MNDFPKLKICIDHGGGFLPFYSGRFDRAFEARPEARKNIDRPPSQYMRRFYYDTAIFDRDMLSFLVKKVGSGRVMLGTDYPLSMCEWDPVGFVKRNRTMSQETKEKILWKNAAKLFKIDV